MLKQFFYFLILSLVMTPGLSRGTELKTISLAPHITELIYAAGAGDSLVGVSAYSNHPPEATEIPVIGDAFRIDLEQIIALQPDLVFYWQGTTTNQVLQQLQQHQLTAVPIQIDTLKDIGQALLTITKHLNLPEPVAYRSFMAELNNHQQQIPAKQSVFIKLSEQPLYTVSSQHWMSEAAALCGLDNIFKDLATTAATVSKEAVIGRNPDVIIQMQAVNPDGPLQQWPQITAIENQHIIVVDPDTFSRPTPRILDAVTKLCRQLDQFSDTTGE